MFDKIVFPVFEGLPFQVQPPTVDGYIEPEQLEGPGQTGVPTAPGDIPHPGPEVGYTHGARFSYGDGGGTGIAVSALQGVWDPASQLLYLGFLVRYDFSFDDQDRIVVVLRDPYLVNPGQSSDTRRIDILPLATGSGAQAPDNPTLPGGIPQPSLHARWDKPPRTPPAFYKLNAAGATPVWLADSQPANFDVKVRSVHSDGSSAYYWSVELKIPTSMTSGGASWINLSPSFGLYTNIIRVCTSCTGLPIDGFPSTQFTWPLNPAAPDDRTIQDQGGAELTPDNWDIPANWLGEATLLAPGATNPARGVKFQNGVFSIGVRQGLNVSSAIGDTLDMTAVGNQNTLVARLVNDDQTNPTPQVNAEFRLADFGIGGGMPGVWAKVPSTPNPSALAAVPAPAGMATPAPVDLTSIWTIAAGDRSKYQSLWTDQCLWVTLSSTNAANIVEESMRRNLTVHTMSEYAGGFTISGEGYGPPPDGASDHDFLLHSVAVQLNLFRHAEEKERLSHPLVSGTSAGDGAQPPVTWLWVTNGYRDTARTLTINGNKYRIYVHAGSFGHVFVHEVEGTEAPESIDLGVAFSGGGLQRHSPSLSTLRVPNGGAVTVRTRFSVVPRSVGTARGCLSWLAPLLRWLRKLLGQ